MALRLGTVAGRVRLPGGPLIDMGRWSNGQTLLLQSRDQGSIPWRSTRMEGSRIRLAGPIWNVGSPQGDEGSTPLPSAHAPVVKRTSCLASNEAFRVRLLAGVVGQRQSAAAVGRTDCPLPLPTATDPTVPWSSGQGASPTRRRSVVRFHPGLLTDGLPDLATGLAWNASEPQGLVGSTPTPSAVSVV